MSEAKQGRVAITLGSPEFQPWPQGPEELSPLIYPCFQSFLKNLQRYFLKQVSTPFSSRSDDNDADGDGKKLKKKTQNVYVLTMCQAPLCIYFLFIYFK